MIEEAAARAHSLPTARRLTSPGNHSAVSSLPAVVAEIALVSVSNSWQRTLKNPLGSICGNENTQANSDFCVQGVSSATKGHPARAHGALLEVRTSSHVGM